MTQETASIEQMVRYALKGNGQATSFFLMLRDVLHFWDDLVDDDVEISPKDINLSMFKALVAIPGNGFYRDNFEHLSPVIVNAIANWIAANEFEGGEDERRLQLAFVIRSDYANILIQCAYLVGGYDWMVAVTPVIRDMWTSEDFAQYMGNLRTEKAARLLKTGGTNVL